MLIALTTLLVAALPEGLQTSVQAALVLENGHAEVTLFEPGRGCTPRAFQVPKVRASGRVALRFSGVDAHGAECEAWAFATVKVKAKALVAKVDLHEGDALGASVEVEEREVLAGREPLSATAPSAHATKLIRAGEQIFATSIRGGPRLGTPVTVVLIEKELQLEQPAVIASCGSSNPEVACATLPSGRRVQGRYLDGKLMIEVSL